LQAIERSVDRPEADRLAGAPLDFVGNGDPVTAPAKMNDRE
jgi:hypothetical protein